MFSAIFNKLVNSKNYFANFLFRLKLVVNTNSFKDYQQ